MNWNEVKEKANYLKSLQGQWDTFKDMKKPFDRCKQSDEIYKAVKVEDPFYIKSLCDELFEKGAMWKLKRNIYPYDMPDSVLHYNLWFNPRFYNDIDDEKEIETILSKYFTDYVWYLNPPAWRSISSIPHIHVFAKADKTSCKESEC